MSADSLAGTNGVATGTAAATKPAAMDKTTIGPVRSLVTGCTCAAVSMSLAGIVVTMMGSKTLRYVLVPAWSPTWRLTPVK